MSVFKKNQHVEKIGHRETNGLLFGECYVFPKLDGTNASVWMMDENVQFGSRNRQLEEGKDNAGFMAWGLNQHKFVDLFAQYPNLRLYGEWLVPHTLKTYEDSAWRKFHVFDVKDSKDNYVPYDQYCGILELYGIDYIPPLAIINNPRIEDIEHYMNENKYLIKDGEGCGEGVVVKNYNFQSDNGKIRWAKFVRNNFRGEHAKQFGVPVRATTSETEAKIAEAFVTRTNVDKVIAKLTLNEEWTNKMIPRVLSTVHYDVIQEEMWTILKKFKNPTIDFGRFQGLVYQRTKTLMAQREREIAEAFTVHGQENKDAD